MSLAFLSKKSWHTATIHNQERVWKAEQEKEQERKKTELLRKQMMEEREMDEMRKLQGRDPSKEKLAWMYAPVGIQNDADDYLMGKPKEAEQEDQELKKLVTSQGVGSTFVKDSAPDVAKSYRDDLSKIRDDPLFAIKQQEKKARERILDNPLKVAEFKKELDEKRKRKAERKEAKKAKKEAKKEAKSHKRSREGSSSREESMNRRGIEGKSADGRSGGSGIERGREEEGRGQGESGARWGLWRPDGGSGGGGGGGRGDVKAGARVTKETQWRVGGRAGIIDNGAEAARIYHAQRKELREEDRRRRLAEMERDAAAHEELRYSRVSAAKARDQGDADRPGTGGKGEAAAQEAEFLSRMNRETVMAGAGGSLEQRIAQRRHYHERGVERD